MNTSIIWSLFCNEAYVEILQKMKTNLFNHYYYGFENQHFLFDMEDVVMGKMRSDFE